MRSEPHPENESALGRLVRRSETVNLFMPLVVDDDGAALSAAPESLHECDARAGQSVRSLAETLEQAFRLFAMTVTFGLPNPQDKQPNR